MPADNAATKSDERHVLLGDPEASDERHVLLGDPEALVEVFKDGSVEVTLGQVIYLSVERLGEIVAFVENHAQVIVVDRDV